jgi:hypothetical protein
LSEASKPQILQPFGVKGIYNWRILMNSESFDLITQELLKHQRTMELLQAENQELRQQIADLRDGRGIFIEINGQRFALNVSFISQTSSVELSPPTQQSDPVINEKSVEENAEGLAVKNAERASQIENNKQEKTNNNITFLEEIMISEFASDLTSPLTLLQDPIGQQEGQNQEKSEEDQKAVLRRDLMGSYLLD